MLRGRQCSVSLPCGSVIAHKLEARSSYLKLAMPLRNHGKDIELLVLSLYTCR